MIRDCRYCGRNESEGHQCRGLTQLRNALKLGFAPLHHPFIDELFILHEEDQLRQFETGATRDSDAGKIDYHGFLSHEVLRKYGEYMMRHQKQADGQMRASDNWKKGIPREQYIKSMFRHFMEVVDMHQRDEFLGKFGASSAGDPEFSHEFDEALYALMFNVMGYAYEREMGR